MAGMRMATRRDTSTQKHSPSTPWVCLHISLLHRHQQCLIPFTLTTSDRFPAHSSRLCQRCCLVPRLHAQRQGHRLRKGVLTCSLHMTWLLGDVHRLTTWGSVAIHLMMVAFCQRAVENLCHRIILKKGFLQRQ
jgi:hypothetical protein